MCVIEVFPISKKHSLKKRSLSGWKDLKNNPACGIEKCCAKILSARLLDSKARNIIFHALFFGEKTKLFTFCEIFLFSSKSKLIILMNIVSGRSGERKLKIRSITDKEGFGNLFAYRTTPGKIRRELQIGFYISSLKIEKYSA